jgi:hypothetical protein
MTMTIKLTCAVVMKWLTIGTFVSVTQANVPVQQQLQRRIMGAKASKVASTGRDDPYHSAPQPPYPIDDQNRIPTNIEETWWKGDPHHFHTQVGKGKGSTKSTKGKVAWYSP